MNAQELLDYCRQHGIGLTLHEGRIRCKAPKGSLTDELTAALKECREELIALLAERAEAAAAPLSRGPGGPGLLSFPQQRLWLIHQLQPASGAYNIPAAIRLDGELELPALRYALNEIVRRHEILRTRFESEEGMALQIVGPALDLPIALEDLGHLTPADQEARVMQCAREESLAPFDLRHGPLIRARLLRLGATAHVALLTLHHIAADGWSIGVLINELGALYGARVKGEPSPLAEPEIQYADYAAWQRSWFSGQEREAQLRYWKERLAGSEPLLALPADRPRPAEQSFRGASVPVEIDEATTRGLYAVSAAARATLFMTLAGAFSALLARYSGQEEILLGTAIANRRRPELSPLIGMFTNTLVLKNRVDPRAPFLAWLESVRAATLEAYDHQDAPFEEIVDAINPRRDLSYSPIFQVMFLLQNAPEGRLELPGLSVRQLPVATETVKCDLSLELRESAGRLSGRLEYSVDLFDRPRIERMARHFVQLLESVVAEPACAVGALELLDGRERHELLVEWNATDAPLDDWCSLPAAVAAQAALTPAAVALVCGERTMSYAELEAQANRLAHWLRGRGIGPESLVGLCSGRSPEMVVGLLGVLKAGAAYIPLDPDYPRERLAHMLEDGRPAALLTEERLLERLPERLPALTLRLDTQAVELAACPATAPAVALPADGLAYVIYTSGSTGRPKGVGVSHLNMANFLRAMRKRPGLTASDTLLAVTSLSFDIAVLELLLPLSVGAKVIIATRDAALAPAALAQLIEAHAVTAMQATPATWHMLSQHPWPRTAAPLKVICGGEALDAELAGRLLGQVPAVWNMYGPTETTVWSALCEVRSAAAPPPVGRPIDNTGIYILDRELNPVPAGVVGEIYIGGSGVARGYLGQPALTAERFLPNPFSARPGARMYRTGDLGRYREEGTIECLGRIDSQVKVRGYRIEPGEVEAALMRQPAVEQAVVVARGGSVGDRQLVGYVVQRPEKRADAPAFSIFYFGADLYEAHDKYALCVNAARAADAAGFEAVWTPERHFDAVGSLHPNPAVLCAALAMVTERLHVRAGSVVLPLHDPLRVAEEWSMVDNLSKGRVGVGIASGWHPRDFVLLPENFPRRHEVMAQSINTLRTLWRGDTIDLTDGAGKPVAIGAWPRPMRGELPIWITAAENPETFILAGRLGANLLTHLLGQTTGQLAAKIRLYRESLAASGYGPEVGKVTLMVHAYVGDDLQEILEHTKEPFLNYLRGHIGLLKPLVKSLDIAVDNLTQEDLEGIVSVAFERYSRTASLIGTPESCLPFARTLEEIGVNEIACLIDWIEPERALAGIAGLKRLKELVEHSTLSAAALKEGLRNELPDYMIPARIVTLDALPRTPNGKVDRRALPEPGLPEAAGFMAPRNAMEALIAKEWCAVLKRHAVGVQENFFELGGNSLLAVTLIERLRKRGHVLDVRTLFATPTVAAMAEAAAAGGVEVEVPPNRIPEQCDRIEPAMLPLVRLGEAEIATICARVEGGARNVQDIYPLAPLQEGILFHHLMALEEDPYVLPASFRFVSREQLTQFLAALQEVVDRHDILRTSVVWEGLSEPVQVVWRRAPLSVQPVALEAGDLQARLTALADGPSARIDVQRAPMLRCFSAQEGGDGQWWLLIVMHHLVGDHTTLDVIVEEVHEILSGRRDRLPRAIPFRNFVAQAKLAVAQAEHERFFGAMLGEVESPTVPFGLEEVRGDGLGIDESSLTLAPELARRLHEQARRLGVTVASLMHLAWARVLAQASGREQVVFGTVLFGRMQGGEGADRVLGLFINTLPLLVEVRDRGVAAAVRAVHASLTALLRHEHASLALAQRCSRVRAPAPLFSAILNYRYSAINAEDEAQAGRAQAARGIFAMGVRERTNYPLTLTVDDDMGGGFRLTAQVTGAVAAGRICGYMSTALEALAEALAERPELPVNALELLPAAERQRQLKEWNDTVVAAPEPLLLPDLIARQAAATPDAPALADPFCDLSYGELMAQADRLAAALQARGVGRGDRVGLCVERGAAMVSALIGILRSGAAYLPLDPAYPAQRLGYMVSQAAPRLLITQAGLLPEGVADGVPCLLIDGAWEAPPAHPPQPRLHPDDIAYVIYTSGSTGRPKGVEVSHGALANFLRSMLREPGIGADDVLLSVTSLSFDIAALELFGPLAAGGRTVVAGREAAGDPAALSDLIRRFGVTLMQATPATWRMLTDDGRGGELAGLKVLCGGEPLPAPLAARLLAHVRELWNLYGPTETTVWSTAQRITDPGQPVTIGRPIANTRVYLLGPDLGPVPVGAAGELCIAGEGVARGYLEQPGITAERFLPDPFGPAGSRMYRTGDLARYLADGRIEFLGRLDQQVKVRGFRIEPGEIEAVLGQLPGVREAVVLAREGSGGEPLLVGFWVPAAEGPAPDAATLRSELRRRLPEYMVPTRFVALAAVPLTGSGKRDRKALLALDEERPAESYAAPESPLQHTLAAIWAEVLKRERVGIRDNFFDLGGHSLLATQVISKVRSALKQEVPVRALFEGPTVELLARRLEAEAAPAAAGPIPPAERGGALPLSFAQQRLWFIQQLEPASAVYNVPLALRMTGNLEVAALVRALNGLIARHEILRTAFSNRAGAAQQQILPRAQLAVPLTDLSALEEPQRQAAAERALKEEARHPFNLAEAPLLRVRLLRLSDAEHLAILTLHHIVTDGWSMGVLVRELAALYTAEAGGQPLSLPALPVQYADYALWQRARFSAGAGEASARFWQERLRDAPPLLALPTDRPRPAVQSFAGALLPFTIPGPVTAGLRALARRADASLFMTLAAALNVLLARYSGQHDLCIGTPIANRTRTELEGLIGFFVNTLVLRNQVDPARPFEAFLQEVRASTLAAYEHQEFPFEQVVEAVTTSRSLSHPPLVQVLLVLQNAPFERVELPGLTLTRVLNHNDTVKFDLVVEMEEQGEALGGVLEYNVALFDRETMERLAAHWGALLRSVAQAPHCRIADLDMLGEEERRQLPRLWNGAATPFPRGSLHALFEAQAQRIPEAVAARCGEAQVSYGELNRRANRLARLLRGRRAGEERPVAICIERSIDALVALLAILKAGSAYLPLDPAGPLERNRGIVEELGLEFVLAGEGVAQGLPAGLPLLPLAEAEAAAAALPDTNPGREVEPGRLAYAMYTSGSTGRPKAVEVSHRNIVRLVQGADYFTVAQGDRILMYAPLGFDASTFEVWAALLNGATLVIAPPGLLEAKRLGRLIAGERIDTLWLTAGLFNQMVELECEQLRNVRQLITGGEAMSPAHGQRFAEICPQSTLINGYGPTECTTFACCGAVPADFHWQTAPPIGRPIANTRVYLLDEMQNPVPAGVTGELYIGGEGVARGYRNRPDLTAERFLPDPFAGEGARMYRTGDLARYNRQGEIEYLGRNDQQVKIRGFRIEPGEIESALAALPGIDEAVVVARRDESGMQQLVAYYVAAQGADAPEPGALRGLLAGRLPEYMLPAYFVPLAQLPLSANGKVARAQLPAPLRAAPAQRLAPRTGIESSLARLWAQVLPPVEFGIDENFFEVGGSSLTLMKLHALVAAQFGEQVSILDLFKYPTIARLAEYLAEGDAAAGDLRGEAIARGEARRAQLARRTANRAGTH